MPDLYYHCKHTKEVFGRDYKEFHAWKDSGRLKHKWFHRFLAPHVLSSWYYSLNTCDPAVPFVSLLHDFDDLKETFELVNRLRNVHYNPKLFKYELDKRLDSYSFQNADK